MANAHVEEFTLSQNVPAVKLISPALEVVVLPHKGADIYQIIDRASNVDVLMKTPQGLRPPNHGWYAPDSITAWLEQYEGGWQEIFPNGGDPNVSNGVELSFHGESSLTPYTYKIVHGEGDSVQVDFSVKLYRTPFELTRSMILKDNVLHLKETLHNYSRVPIAFMWGHHIAFGAPFISDQTELQTNAARLLADDRHDSPENILSPGSEHAFPSITDKEGRKVDFAQMPGQEDTRSTLAYLTDFGDPPWYALVNRSMKLGVGVAWTPDVFTNCWLWQEMYASKAFPFYGSVYTVAIEPWTSFPGQGLAHVQETTQTHRILEPDESLNAELTFTTFQAAQSGKVDRITPDGQVLMKEV